MSKEVIKNGEGIIPEGTKVISAETFADCTDLTRPYMISPIRLQSW